MPSRLSVSATIGCLVFQVCLLGACSTSAEPTSAGLSPPAAPPAAEVAGYQLNAKELKMSCKDLTGTMRIRIAQLRARKPSQDSTAVSQGMQSVATKIWGGPEYGGNSTNDRTRDRAQLYAYNRQLAAKKCPTLNLESELGGG